MHLCIMVTSFRMSLSLIGSQFNDRSPSEMWGHMITKFSGWVDLLTHGAPLAHFARESSAVKRGFKLSNSSYSTTDTIHENSNFTIFIAFFHDPSKKVDIAVTRSNYKQYPRFKIDKTVMWIGDAFHSQKMTIPSEFHNKQIVLWMPKN